MWFLYVVLIFSIALVLHAIVCRVSIAADRVLKFVTVSSPCGLVLVYMLIGEYGVFSLETISAILVYGCLCEFYVFMFTMTISSLSSNILIRLSFMPIPLENMKDSYGSKEMILNRIVRLRKIGVLSCNNGFLELTHKGQRLLGLFLKLRRFFCH